MPLECPSGQIPNAAGTACVEDDVDRWYSDPNFWAAMRREEENSGSRPDPFAMILALIAAGQRPGAIDPVAPVSTNGTNGTNGATSGPPTWFWPAALGLGAVVLLRR